MSLSDTFLTDDEFQCSICLDLFTNPASTPCGHSFCMRCINKYWDAAKVCQCPLCKKTFQKRPELQINRTLREITEHFKTMRGETGIRGKGGKKRGKPQHNLLNELQRKLSKPLAMLSHNHHPRDHEGVQLASSLPESQSLLASHSPNGSPPLHYSSPPHYGSPSLRNGSPPLRNGSPPLHNGSPPLHNGSPPLHYDSPPLHYGSPPLHYGSPPLHYGSPPLHNGCPPLHSESLPHHSPIHRFRHTSRQRRFTLSGAADVKSLPLCETHNRGIMLYCQTDQMCICPECEELDHPDHDTISIEAQWKETKVQLDSLEQEIQDMIKERIGKMEEIRESMSELELLVQKETAGNVSLFSSLVVAVERAQSELMETMETKRRAAELQAEAATQQIQLEVDQLRTRQIQLEGLRKTDDHIEALKLFVLLSAPTPTTDWPDFTVTSDLGAGAIYRSLSVQLQKFQDELQTIAETGFPASVLETTLARTQPRVKGVQEYAVDITLDLNTAHPRLILSDDLKSVKCGDRNQMLPDNPERFDRVLCVLGREEIFSGRHYWEVEVGGKTDWDLGVAKSSINRKGKIEVTPSNGFWFLSLRDKSKYAFRNEPSTDVGLNLHPHKIGVFLDYENGQVSFYNVDAKIHIFTFNDFFYDSVFPFFSPCTSKNGKNDAPLIIATVSETD